MRTGQQRGQTFYCPVDKRPTSTPTSWVLVTQFGSSGGPFAEEYVVAHEDHSHHVQNSAEVLGRARQECANCCGQWRAHGVTSGLLRRGVGILRVHRQAGEHRPGAVERQGHQDALAAAAASGRRPYPTATGRTSETWTWLGRNGRSGSLSDTRLATPTSATPFRRGPGVGG